MMIRREGFRGDQVRHHIRFAAVIACGLTTAAGGAKAQSPADGTLPVRGAPPPSSGPAGNWTTVVTPEPELPEWVPVVARNWLTAPSHVTAISTATAARSEAEPARGPHITGERHALTGMASFYGQGEVTAAGERFDPTAMTAAHRTLPFGTKVRVTRVDTGNSVIVRINDRGPFKPGRVIDLSQGAAENLGMTSIGLTPVRLEVLGQ
jgi:rare lipoprotein A